MTMEFVEYIFVVNQCIINYYDDAARPMAASDAYLSSCPSDFLH